MAIQGYVAAIPSYIASCYPEYSGVEKAYVSTTVTSTNMSQSHMTYYVIMHSYISVVLLMSDHFKKC